VHAKNVLTRLKGLKRDIFIKLEKSMIKIRVSDFEEQGKAYLESLMNKKPSELRKEMVKFLNESEWPDTYDYRIVLEFINDFFLIGMDDRNENRNEDE